MTDFSRRHPFLVFYLIAILIYAAGVQLVPMSREGGILPAYWAWLEAQKLSINLYSITRFGIEEEAGMLLTYLRAGAPTIAALIVCALIGGSGAVRDLVGRLRPWLSTKSQKHAVRAYVILLLLYFGGAIAFIVLGIIYATPDEAASVADRIGGYGLAGAAFLSISLFIDEGGTLEELGWRGFALPLLLRRYRSPLTTSIILGVVWWAWHLPREIIDLPENYANLAYWTGQGKFVALCVGLSVITTYFVFRTGGSVLPAIMIHGGTNAWSKALADPIFSSLQIDLRLWIVLIGAVLLVMIVGPGLGREPEQELPSPLPE